MLVKTASSVEPNASFKGGDMKKLTYSVTDLRQLGHGSKKEAKAGPRIVKVISSSPSSNSESSSSSFLQDLSKKIIFPGSEKGVRGGGGNGGGGKNTGKKSRGSGGNGGAASSRQGKPAHASSADILPISKIKVKESVDEHGFFMREELTDDEGGDEGTQMRSKTVDSVPFPSPFPSPSPSASASASPSPFLSPSPSPTLSSPL
jgi:hypothetical protein